jgi:GT2 family glycosyltransferase
MPKVSVIVNTVDRAEDLERCLKSIFLQSYRDFEVVVVNNGLGQTTRDLLDREVIKFLDDKIQFSIVEDETKRLSYLFNEGWKKSSPETKYLAYLADDTEADPQYLAQAVEYLDGNNQVAAVSGPVLSTSNPPGEMNYLYDLAKKTFLTKVLLKVYEYFVMENRLFEPGHWCQSGAFTLGAGIPQTQIKEPIEVDLLTSTSMVIRRKALEKVEGFDENFLFNHADGDLFIRLKMMGYKLVFHPLVKVWHHMRFGPTRYPQILGRDTAFYYLKDVRPKSLRGWIGALMNLTVFNLYFIFKALQTRNLRQLRGLAGFIKGVFDFFGSCTKESLNLLSKLSVVIGFLGLMYFVHRRIGNWGMLAYGDATPFPNNFKEAFQFFFQSYDPRSPGINMPQASVILSTLIPIEALVAWIFGGSFVWAQRIYHLLPIPLSFVTIYFFISKFTKSRLAAFVTAVIYSGNHFMVGEFAGGFEGNLYIPALLPLLVYLLHQIYLRSSQKLSFVRELLIYSVLLAFSYVLSDHVLILLVPFWLTFILFPIFSREGNPLKLVFRNMVAIATSSFVAVSISAYHAYSYFKIALPFLSQQTIPQDLIPFFVTNIWDTYWRMTLGNVLRLGGSYFSNFYNGDDTWARLGLVIPILAFSWFVFKENRTGKRLKLGLLFSFLAVLDVVFIFLTSRGVTIPLFTSVPLLFRFRNPSRLSLFLAFLYSPLIAMTLDSYVTRIAYFIKQRKVIFAFLSSAFLVLGLVGILIYLKGFFTGDFTMSKNRVDNFWIKDRYYKLSNFISNERAAHGAFRTAYFPWTHEGTEIKMFWLDPYAFGVPIEYGAYIRNDYLSFLKTVYAGVAEERVKDLGGLMAEGAIRYVVVDSNSTESGRALYRFDYHVPWLLGSFDDINRIISGHQELKLVKDIDGFKVYENTRYDASKVDAKKAGFYMDNQRVEDGVRQGLMFYTALSWVVLIAVYFKPRIFIRIFRARI